VKAAQLKGINVEGPFPCDTIFLKRSQYDGIVTMYHDQGQIALKLLSFAGGVTVQGGLPVIISTPAHGTAFEIAGKNLADLDSTQNAFDVAVQMAIRRESSKDRSSELVYAASLEKVGPYVSVVGVAVPSCC
jgi:4-hydroxy-L-threonine phosphate dehydrogenase PdxA